MNWGSYLFGFQGRINRAKLWLFLLVVIVIEVVYFTMISMMFGMTIFTAMMAGGGHAGAALAGGASILIFALISCAIFIVILIAAIAVTVKRLHDRDKSAIWLLVFWLLPAVLNMIGIASSPGEASGGRGAVALICGLASLGIAIWAFVELYCLRGTVGDNRFGPDPLAGHV